MNECSYTKKLGKKKPSIFLLAFVGLLIEIVANRACKSHEIEFSFKIVDGASLNSVVVANYDDYIHVRMRIAHLLPRID